MIASRARRDSADTSASAFVCVDVGEIGHAERWRPDPDDLDVPECCRLVEVDEALFEEFEHGQKAHDDLKSFHQCAG